MEYLIAFLVPVLGIGIGLLIMVIASMFLLVCAALGAIIKKTIQSKSKYKSQIETELHDLNDMVKYNQKLMSI